MNKRYVLDAAGVEAVNRAISRVGNTPPAMLDTNRRHRITVTEGGGYEYNGYFKVVETTDESGKTMLKIIDGAKPYSNVAGVSDLGSVGQLTIEKKNSSYLYIYPEWIKDSNPPRYTFKLSTRGNSSIDIEFLLATIDENGIITQRWTAGTIYWGSRFFV